MTFTATPKNKTLQLFGRRPHPERPEAPDNLPAPVQVYSMRQAIEEGFILDVLKNYTPYRLAFRLAHDGKEFDETEVERSAATRSLMQWVRLHPYNISQRVGIVVEHFREMVAPLLDGKAKAMAVLASRKEAVRWKLALDATIRDRGYRLGTLVAFSGEVNDPETRADPFTEASATLNLTLKGRDIRDAFKGDDHQLLLVANKFQTGFDQPLLCGMYVDRRLAGIQAVQTLSWLNRAYPGKDTTYVLAFVNSSEEVLEAFKTYYTTAELAGVTDPNVIFDLRAKLDAGGWYEGRKDRNAMLSPQLLGLLRLWWREGKRRNVILHHGWLFPGRNALEQISTGQLNRDTHEAAEAAGITKRVTPHTLRHSFATHLLEQDARYPGHPDARPDARTLEYPQIPIVHLRNPAGLCLGGFRTPALIKPDRLAGRHPELSP